MNLEGDAYVFVHEKSRTNTWWTLNNKTSEIERVAKKHTQQKAKDDNAHVVKFQQNTEKNANERIINYYLREQPTVF